MMGVRRADALNPQSDSWAGPVFVRVADRDLKMGEDCHWQFCAAIDSDEPCICPQITLAEMRYPSFGSNKRGIMVDGVRYVPGRMYTIEEMTGPVCRIMVEHIPGFDLANAYDQSLQDAIEEAHAKPGNVEPVWEGVLNGAGFKPVVLTHHEREGAIARSVGHHENEFARLAMEQAQLLLEEQPDRPGMDALNRAMSRHASILAELRR